MKQIVQTTFLASLFAVSALLPVNGASGSNNLLTDPSFELTTPADANSIPQTTTGQWMFILNVSFELSDATMTNPRIPDTAHDGTRLALFGLPTGFFTPSVLMQSVPALPGQEFEARAWAQSPSGDSIAGKQSFAGLQI